MPTTMLLYLGDPGRWGVPLASPLPGDPWRVAPAADASAAMRRLAVEPYDVLLVDREAADRQPGEDVGRLRDLAAHRRVPVVLLGPDAIRADGLDDLARLVERCRIDRQLAQLREVGGAEFVTEMIDLFLAQTPAQLGDLRAAVAAGDAKRARQVAHSLKSAAGNFGARAVQELAFQIEAGTGDSAAVLTQLDEAYERAKEHLAGRR